MNSSSNSSNQNRGEYRRRLIIRISSLGDVVLSMAALSVQNSKAHTEWLVANEFSQLLIENRRVQKVWSFDRRMSVFRWVRLCLELWDQNYDEVLDLHRSLRSFILRFMFKIWGLLGLHRRKCPKFMVIQKQKLRSWTYFLLKKKCPNFFRPTPWVERYAKAIGGTGAERPDLSHLINTEIPDSSLKEQKYYCVMPGSKWPGKCWPIEYYVRLLTHIPALPVILGSDSDRESMELVKALAARNIKHQSYVGKIDLKQTAAILAHSVAYLGNDTGLAHLAEAVGSRALVIYGPTVPDMGFGPWRKDSRSFSSLVWCSPCGKDGRYCYQLEQYKCLRSIFPEVVLTQLKDSFKES